jgi:hypothetical protein
MEPHIIGTLGQTNSEIPKVFSWKGLLLPPLKYTLELETFTVFTLGGKALVFSMLHGN